MSAGPKKKTCDNEQQRDKDVGDCGSRLFESNKSAGARTDYGKAGQSYTLAADIKQDPQRKYNTYSVRVTLYLIGYPNSTI